MLINQWLASCNFCEELVRFLNLIHSCKLHFDCSNLVAQLLVAEITSLLIRLHLMVDLRNGRGLNGCRSDRTRLLNQEFPIGQQLLQTG